MKVVVDYFSSNYGLSVEDVFEDARICVQEDTGICNLEFECSNNSQALGLDISFGPKVSIPAKNISGTMMRMYPKYLVDQEGHILKKDDEEFRYADGWFTLSVILDGIDNNAGSYPVTQFNVNAKNSVCISFIPDTLLRRDPNEFELVEIEL